MKLDDFYQIQDVKSRLSELENQIVATMQGNIDEAKEFVENNEFDPEYEDSEESTAKALAKETITDPEDVFGLDSTYYDGQTFILGEEDKYVELKEELESLEDDAEKIIGIYNHIVNMGYHVKEIDHSTKSLSTYLLLPIDELNDFMKDYDGPADDSEFEKDDSNEYFGVRIADHSSGTHFIKSVGMSVSYPNNYINIDFHDFF
ncbi:hypothetical protein FEZ51_10075 [Pediococcus stilesii]|uniref:Uncharacterized protein n=1 Tax=Pediococcus stilesii TaxID=331679 RepID=A0A5R9BRQ1_9LACO|nr:hypothetical protein [Pediococcus stilesii]TLQ03287.1 hypothetical protein FEZ51_10075 [Pediococcus stilesii]